MGADPFILLFHAHSYYRNERKKKFVCDLCIFNIHHMQFIMSVYIGQLLMPKIFGVSELKLQIFILGPEVPLTSYILS